ncbi:hypothetical protein BFJ63_vAg20309 [Fusarium oxysporum f. sp. narcissi]|uniref:Uncharacterized protein n=1 Tax=Fusarium oxysporum f. sp. narcissi TaxID=451672 RepID=A0A4Q2USI4_FUSOX|nr:hypothetical protein BFJ63_vAg20309 [Fusarium oxysporum f. sp. narcissi]
MGCKSRTGPWNLGTASSRSIANEHQGQEAANTAESAANTA